MIMFFAALGSAVLAIISSTLICAPMCCFADEQVKSLHIGTHESDTCVGHMCPLKTIVCHVKVFCEHIFTRVSTENNRLSGENIHMSDTYVRNTCRIYVFINVFSSRKCPTHVLDTGIQHMCTNLQLVMFTSLLFVTPCCLYLLHRIKITVNCTTH